MKGKKLFFYTTLLCSLASCASPGMITNNEVGNAEGKACKRNILGIIPLSLDNSIYTAAKNGEVRKIATVDYTSLYLGVYNYRCTIVHGTR